MAVPRCRPRGRTAASAGAWVLGGTGGNGFWAERFWWGTSRTRATNGNRRKNERQRLMVILVGASNAKQSMPRRKQAKLSRRVSASAAGIQGRWIQQGRE